MRALRIHAYGGPEQLRVDDVPAPHAGPGEIRIRVSAASINPMDGKILRGLLAGGAALVEPMGLGFDASGVVDEVGEGVAGVSMGDDVFGLGSQTQAEHAVLTAWTAKPASLDWGVAGAAGVAAETAIRTLDLMGVGRGSTVLVDGGSGGVGAVAVQIAVARGATVVATASEANQDYLREIRAIPVVYGDGWVQRVADAGVGRLDGVFDAAGKTPITDLVALVDDPAQVVSIANFSAAEAGARVTTGGEGDKVAALSEAARLLENSRLVIKAQTFPLDRAAEGYRTILSGHTRGKIVLLPEVGDVIPEVSDVSPTGDVGIRAEIGIIGGSGFYSFLTDPELVTIETPFGEPSAPVAIGRLAGRSVAFLPRHGTAHQFPPHRVNYRANLWALRSVGARQVLAPSAVGSLRPELGPGTVVVPDQVVDRTWGRPHTVYDTTGSVVHTSFGDPYCPRGRRAVTGARDDVVDGGTLVVINGPRFSSRAESLWHAAQGWSVVGMTGQPEATVARELALCFTCITLVTDRDAGVPSEAEGDGDPVTHAEVLEMFAANIDRLKDLLATAVSALPAYESDADASCSCRRALDGLNLPFTLP